MAIFAPANGQESNGGHYYYVCTYNYGYEITIQLKKINLDQKAIVNTVDTPIKGWVPLGTPLTVERNGKQFFIVVANDGEPAKNSDFLPYPVLNYSVINSNMQLGASRHLDSMTLVDIYRYPEKSPSYKVFEDHGESEVIFRGKPALGPEDSLEFIERRYYPQSENEQPIISGYQYFERIYPSNDRYYWFANCNRGIDLLVIDYPNRILIKSREIANNRNHGNLFALSDSVIYAFFTNCNIVGGSIESLQKLDRDSSYLITYKPETLEQIDSIWLPYPSLDSGYVAGETGICDRVGPYMVYYFFNDDGIELYAPAMLFIFDTRTNEATWLRVGWR